MGYTNSSLVSYTLISPNKSCNRNHCIDTITIHCFVGQVTAKRGAEVFQPVDKKASCNYVVGKDGDISLVVEEKDRSWCSSDAQNDNRAITIEVASDTTHPYAITDKAMTGLINLCADICKRNGIQKLVWSNNKEDRVYHQNGCNMTVHRDYAAKACPGDYIYSRLGSIAEQVNKLLGQQVVVQPAVLNKINNELDIFNFFRSKGLTVAGTCGLMGNLVAESGLRSNNMQNSYETQLGLTDTTYTQAVDTGAYSENDFVHDKVGYGLAQWTFWSRKQNLFNYKKQLGCSIGNMEMQCNFLYKELQTSYKSVLNFLTTNNDIKSCSDYVLLNFEKPKNQGDAVKDTRYKYSKQVYDRCVTNVSGNTGHTVDIVDTTTKNNSTPFKVRVNISNLRIRKGPGTNYAKTGIFTGVGVFTIVEKQAGAGSNKGWGKLKSGAGWISLDYCDLVK